MEFEVQTEKREQIIDITQQVKQFIEKFDAKQRAKANAVLVYAPHATCAIIVNENYDKAVCDDILDFLKKVVPQGVWKHDVIDSNADAHIKAAIIGPSQIVPLEKGKKGKNKLQLGQWQGIALAEFDGPRKRKVIIKLI